MSYLLQIWITLQLNAPSTIRVSNLAAPGELPTWDPTIAGATTADEFDLATNSPIVEMIPFQDSLAIYTEDSIFNYLSQVTQVFLSLSSSLLQDVGCYLFAAEQSLR